jgi:cytochrome c oxidase subunit 4
MSDNHGHGHAEGGDHVPHVLSLRWYFGVFAALIVFTAITVGVSYIDLGRANLFIAMLVATCKALMVAAIFMHLAFDKKFNTVIFLSSVIFLAIFIAFTMFDTNNRGLGGRLSGDRPAVVAEPWSGTRAEAETKAKWQAAPAKEAPAHEAPAQH